MHRFGLALALVVAVTVAVPLSGQYTTTPTVEIESAELGQTREIVIWEPINYHMDPNTLWDVIYVFDAQDRRLFDYVASVANLMKTDDPKGFLVVGIRGMADTENMYFRNNDLLPADTEWNLPGVGGNAEAFLRYVRNEVIPYVESHYRVLPHRTAVGHSLSASFLIDAMLQNAEIFDNYIAVSPNLDIDDQRLVQGLREFDPSRFETPSFFYMSHADEAESWGGWGEANEAAYAVLRDELVDDNFRVVVEEYPEEGHGSGFMPSVNSALRTFLDDIRPLQVAELGDRTYRVTFTVQVPGEDDEIFISGNQESLGDWAQDRVKMERVGPCMRQITVDVRDHVEVKFYRPEGGQGWVAVGEDGGRTTWPVMFRPEQGGTYSFEIVSYTN